MIIGLIIINPPFRSLSTAVHPWGLIKPVKQGIKSLKFICDAAIRPPVICHSRPYIHRDKLRREFRHMSFRFLEENTGIS
jgi:hypothetical protein